jgi:hypothetical protein
MNIPCSTEQGIILTEQGIPTQEKGIFLPKAQAIIG